MHLWVQGSVFVKPFLNWIAKSRAIFDKLLDFFITTCKIIAVSYEICSATEAQKDLQYSVGPISSSSGPLNQLDWS